jgi:protein-S-isoprenylcysteine O-methyltransferase Ste14
MDSGYGAWVARWRVPLGLALGILYLVLAQPDVRLLIAGAGVALAGLILRAWAAGYLEKNDRLATGGPYARTRNPLYLGSFFIGVGLAIAGASWILTVAFVAFSLMVYLPVIRREEESLRRRFGEEYERYAERVPLFFPTARKARPRDGGQFLWSGYRRNHEHEAALGYLAVAVFLWLKIIFR